MEKLKLTMENAIVKATPEQKKIIESCPNAKKCLKKFNDTVSNMTASCVNFGCEKIFG